MNPILLDTHVAIWMADGRVKRETADLITAAGSREELLLSPITAWEIGLLVRRGRLTVTSTVEDYVRGIFSLPGVVQAPLTPAVAVAATKLPGDATPDPADRILVATAAAYGARLLTRDRAILRYAKSTGYVRCVRC